MIRLTSFISFILIFPANVLAQPKFREYTQQAGIFHLFSHDPGMTRNELAMSGGAVAEDFDNDGFLDLYVLQGGEGANLLYMNNGDGTFSDQAMIRGAAIQDTGMGVSAADYDNDGDVDIFFTTLLGGHYLLENNGEGYFQPNNDFIAGLRNNGMSPSWGDIDNDGLLDLSVGLWQESRLGNLLLYHNRGKEGMIQYDFHENEFIDKYVFSARFSDVNNDRLQDMLVTADFGNSQLYLNQGNLKFKRVTNSNGTGSDEHGMGSAVGDYDNDGDVDWFVTSIWDDSGDDGRGSYEWGITGNRFYQNQGNGVFQDKTDETNTRNGNWGWAANFGDLDNDSDLDLFHVNGWLIDIKFNNPFSHIYRFHNQPSRLFLNDGNGMFSEIAQAADAAQTGQGRGCLFFDYDNDGDLDIFICNTFDVSIQGETAAKIPGKPVLLQNISENSNHWLKISLQGKPPYHSHGIGAKIFVKTGALTQMRELHASSNFLSQEPGRIAHFGMNTVPTADSIRVEWSNGDQVIVDNITTDQHLQISSPTGILSKRNAVINEIISGLVTDQNDSEYSYEWEIEGQRYIAFATFSFSSPGDKQINLYVMNKRTGTLIRTERFFVVINNPGTEISDFSIYDYFKRGFE